jgi:hypothetical protein
LSLPSGTSFSAEPIPTRAAVVWDIAGRDKSGKTDFLTQAPGRMAYCDFDGGADGVVQKREFDAQGRKRIFRASYADRELPAGFFAAEQFGEAAEKKRHDLVKDANRPVMLRLMHDVKVGAQSGFFRSICVDTQDEMWQTIRLAHFGRLAKVPGHLYDQANADFAYMIRTAHTAGVNFITASKLEDEWVNKTDERTGEEKRVQSGRSKRAGNDKVNYLVQAYFEARKIDQKGRPPRFELELKQSRKTPGLVGMVWADSEIVFRDIATMLNPDIDPVAWDDRLEAA